MVAYLFVVMCCWLLVGCCVLCVVCCVLFVVVAFFCWLLVCWLLCAVFPFLSLRFFVVCGVCLVVCVL